MILILLNSFKMIMKKCTYLSKIRSDKIYIFDIEVKILELKV